MSMIQKIDQKGFTLVEMVLYMGLLTLLLLLFTNIFMAILDTQLSSQSTGSVAQDGRFLYSRLIYDINRASSISLPANLGNTGNTLQLQINGVSYQYALSSGNLMISDATSSAQLNSYDTKISGLQFKRIGNINGKPTIQMTFTVTSKEVLHGTVDSKSFQTTAGIR
jgi:type II secretory pathway pseudopilin PulG